MRKPKVKPRPSFYERAKDFPTVTRTVLVEVPASTRAWRRGLKRAERKQHILAARAANATAHEAPITMPPLAPPVQKHPAVMASKQLHGSGRVRLTPRQMRRLKRNVARWAKQGAEL